MKGIIRGVLIGITLGIVGVTLADWKGWFAVIALNLIAIIH
jgi:hypothetical protein